MNRDRRSGVCRSVVLTGLVLLMEAANASSGYTVTEQQEQAIQVGMSAAEVQRILGRPMQNSHYRNATGPSWFYDVPGMPVPTVFEIAFSADGKVTSAREYPDLSRNTGP
jgi:outer membrane protein assembly factor BamE (lipoprotein component of BamABCDE complex)